MKIRSKDKKLFILAGLFILGMLIYSIYKPKLVSKVIESFDGYSEINLIENGTFDPSYSGEEGKFVGSAIITAYNAPNDISNALRISTDIVNNIESKYVITIPNINLNGGYTYFVLSSWVYTTSSSLKLFKITYTPGTDIDNSNAYTYETQGTVSNLTTIGNQVWSKHEVIFKVALDTQTIFIELGNLINSGIENEIVYFADIKFFPFLEKDILFPLQNNLLMYLNDTPENLVDDTKNSTRVSLTNNDTTLSLAELSHVLNSIDNIKLSFTLSLKFNWNDTNSAEFTLFNFENVNGGSILKMKIYPNYTEDENVTDKTNKIEIIINEGHETEEVRILSITDIILNNNNIITLSYDNDKSIINMYNNNEDVINEVLTNSTGNTIILTPLNGTKLIIGSNRDGSNTVLSKFVIYNDILDPSKNHITQLHSYLIDTIEPTLLSDTSLLSSDDTIESIVSKYNTYPRVTFNDGVYYVEVFEGTNLQNIVSYFGKRSYGSSKDIAKEIFIKNFDKRVTPDIIPLILRDDYHPTIDINQCPFIIQTDNPCHKEKCYGVDWNNPDYTSMNADCKKDVYDYCSINKGLDDNCKCWSDTHWNTPKCRDFRKSLHRTEYGFDDSNIRDHPDFNSYMHKNECTTYNAGNCLS
jgi:hypothetical protein